MDMSLIRSGKTHNARILRHLPATASIQSRLNDFPASLHPIVYEQPETGRKVLNVILLVCTRYLRDAGGDGDALLEKVVQYAVDEHYAYYHSWKLGEMVLWDNWRMLHCATGTPVDEKRVMQRTTIGGDYGLGRIEPNSGRAKDASEYIQV